MNEAGLKAIELLASKLGTTTEYLFSVLVKQARIAGIVAIIQGIMMVVIGICLVKLIIYFYKKRDDLDSSISEIVVPFTILSFVVLLILAIIYISYADNILAAFFNPEYWALNEILSSIL